MSWLSQILKAKHGIPEVNLAKLDVDSSLDALKRKDIAGFFAALPEEVREAVVEYVFKNFRGRV